MSDLGDPTCWTDREREFFAAGWNECVKMQPGQIERLTERCAAYKGQVEAGAHEIERLRSAKRRALAIADERAIEANRLRAENKRLRAALKPFANYYDLNDCEPRDPRLSLEVPISDLWNAKAALGVQQASSPTEKT